MSLVFYFAPFSSATPVWSALRDLDVAHTETLPPLRDAYVANDTERAGTWDTMQVSLAQCRAERRSAVRFALEQPSVGLCLLQTTQWLDELRKKAHVEKML